MSKTPARWRAEIAGCVSRRDHEGAKAARREYYAAQLEAKIREVVAKAPPLTDEQIERLRALLGPKASS
jgi:hypothetical protein